MKNQNIEETQTFDAPKTAPMTRFKLPDLFKEDLKIDEEEGDDDEQEEAITYQQNFDELMKLFKDSE